MDKLTDVRRGMSLHILKMSKKEDLWSTILQSGLISFLLTIDYIDSYQQGDCTRAETHY
jgi:hypothetical protein